MATRKNKLKQMLASSKHAKQRRVAKALKNYLKQMNPSGKFDGAKVTRGKGGRIIIMPMKANPARGKLYAVKYSWHSPVGAFTKKSDASRMAQQMRDANKQAGLKGSVRVVTL